MSFEWYIVQAVSGFEKKVATSIRENALRKGISDLIEDVVVPVEKILEVRKGKKVEAERKSLPGYVLVKMSFNDDLWHMIKSISKVTGFLGSAGKPRAISEVEVKRIFDQIEQSALVTNSTVTYEIGESVKIIDGPFESFIAVVEGVDLEKTRLKVSVTIFGRSTPVDLDFTQVAKV